MRRGIALSLFMHFCLGIFIMLELPTFVMPEKEITQINVKIVSAPAKAKKDVPAAKPKTVNSQQSAAPKYAPKKQKEAKKEVKHKTKVVKKADSKKVVKKKQEKPKAKPKAKQQKKQEKKTSNRRPEKLDKTNDKKAIVKDKSKKIKPKTKVEDDFLSTLDFIDELDKQQPSVKSDEEGEPTVYDVDQLEIAKIKKVIQDNWYVTAGANKLNKLEAVVRLSLDRDGTVSKVRVIKSSGKGHFDRSLQRAIRKSSPLPIPAEKYEIYKTIELVFSR
jgi:TonB family protein